MACDKIRKAGHVRDGEVDPDARIDGEGVFCTLSMVNMNLS